MKYILAAVITLTIAAVLAVVLPAWSVTKATPLIFCWAYWLMVAGLWLPIMIGRRVLHRVTDGRALLEQQTIPGSKADIDGRVLQNTLEQTVFAVLATGLLVLAQPPHAAMILLAHAVVFSFGRAFFWWGYRHRSPLRVYGFALTFFGSVMVFIYAASFLLRAVFAT